jgi:hypothetical protein
MNILTGGYPAEYGRKLGGVIEVVTEDAVQRGFHGSVAGGIGSFNTKDADANLGYSSQRTSMEVIGGAADTDRYLDPPVEENFTNHGTTGHTSVRFDHDLTDADRLGVIVRYGQSRFQVPNERVQQAAGQDQRRRNGESTAQLSYQHVVSANALVDIRAMFRDLSGQLGSNAASTPVIAQQDRGIRDGHIRTAVSLHAGNHEWKFGGDLVRHGPRALRISDQ